MPKFVVDLKLDGYENGEDEIEACFMFIEEALDFGGSSVSAKLYTNDAVITKLKEALGQIASSPEEGHPANLLKLLAHQALEETK